MRLICGMVIGCLVQKITLKNEVLIDSEGIAI